MVESSATVASSVAKRMTESAGPMQTIYSFFDLKKKVQMQALNKRHYERIIPGMFDVLPMASAELILENNRKQIYTAKWSQSKDLKKFKLLDLGETGGLKEKDLGIRAGEVSWQWFLPVEPGKYLVYPLVEEAYIQQAVMLEFDIGTNKFIKYTEVVDMPMKMMRPTPVRAKLSEALGGDSYLMIGGNEARDSFSYSLKQQKYRKLPKLPVGHNITTTVCVNYRDEAMFTFLHDARLNIKVGVMDLKEMESIEADGEQMQEMKWALKMEHKEHTLDRFHLKNACTMVDGRICLMARGRLPLMKEAVASLLLYFTVEKGADGWKATFQTESTQIIWPTIFPRQLDEIKVCNDTLIFVQDTADGEDFISYSVITSRKRKDEKYQVHKKHNFIN